MERPGLPAQLGRRRQEGGLWLSVSLLMIKLLRQPDEKSFRAANVAEPVYVFIPDHFANKLRAALVEPVKGFVKVRHGEHDTQVTESVYRSGTVIGDRRRCEES